MFRKILIMSLLIINLIGCSQLDTVDELEFINNNLNIGEIKIGMSEDEVIQLQGEGEYVEGFGGHLRKYSDMNLSIGFSDDSDNDLYRRISSLHIRNPDFSIFSVKIGEEKKRGINKLKENGFDIDDNAKDIYVRGEFSVALRGEDQIEYLQIFFNDKDLRDRHY